MSGVEVSEILRELREIVERVVSIDERLAGVAEDVAETKAEAKRTNGRVNAHDTVVALLDKRLSALEDAGVARGRAGWVVAGWVVAAFTGAAVAFLAAVLR